MIAPIVWLICGAVIVAAAAHVAFVRDTWRAVAAPHRTTWNGLLIAFEATVGLRVLSGGRRARLGLPGVIAMPHATVRPRTPVGPPARTLV